LILSCPPTYLIDKGYSFYYLSFDTEEAARDTLEKLNSKAALSLLSLLIFWDEKRPIKTSILNVLDWSRLVQGTQA